MHAPVFDPNTLDALIGRAVSDLSAAHGGVMVSIGFKLGLYKVMVGAGPLTSAEVATRAGCAERYVREWLNSQVAGGYVNYHAISGTYEMSPEQALVMADPDSPAYMTPAWQVTASMWRDEAKTLQAFRTGAGVSWGDHDDALYCGVASFYRNAYRANLIPVWLPALDGVVAQLERGIRVADVGCGYGHSTLLMAQAFPNSRFHGIDGHAPSVAEATRLAAEAGLADRVTFSVGAASSFAGADCGLVCFFDALHDMGDPLAAVRHAHSVLAPDGTVMLVEPFANDRTEDNISPVARLYYSASVSLCCAHAISDGGALVLGAQAGEARLADVFRKAGFTHFRRAHASPFNLVLEARK